MVMPGRRALSPTLLSASVPSSRCIQGRFYSGMGKAIMSFYTCGYIISLRRPVPSSTQCCTTQGGQVLGPVPTWKSKQAWIDPACALRARSEPARRAEDPANRDLGSIVMCCAPPPSSSSPPPHLLLPLLKPPSPPSTPTAYRHGSAVGHEGVPCAGTGWRPAGVLLFWTHDGKSVEESSSPAGLFLLSRLTPPLKPTLCK